MYSKVVHTYVYVHVPNVRAIRAPLLLTYLYLYLYLYHLYLYLTYTYTYTHTYPRYIYVRTVGRYVGRYLLPAYGILSAYYVARYINITIMYLKTFAAVAGFLNFGLLQHPNPLKKYSPAPNFLRNFMTSKIFHSAKIFIPFFWINFFRVSRCN